MARPKKLFSDEQWEQIEKLASIQCTGEEIAAVMKVNYDTLNLRVKERFNESFSDWFKKASAQGKMSLRRWQFEGAQKGNVTLLIWLGKQYLGQADKQEVFRNDLVESKEKPKRSFTDFCLTAGYPAPFPKQIEMMEFGIHNEGARMILGSRGYGKTDYITVLGVAYEIYLDPNFTCLIITKSKVRNSAMLNEIAIALEKNGVRLEKKNSECVRIESLVGKDHSVSATTVKSVSLRGRHPDLVIMDDPVTPDDVGEATRNQVERTYNEICKLTQEVLVIGQPVHQYDLFEKLRPMIKKMEVPYGSIPELDPDLEAMKLAGVDDASISASYYLKVLTEGTTPFDQIRYIDQFPTGDSAVAFIDPSFEGGDYTALTIMKAYMQGVAVVGFTYKKAWNHCLEEVASQMNRFNVRRLCFETNCLGDMPIELLRRTFQGIGVVGKKSNTNKHSRICTAGAFSHLIHLSKESDRIYTDQVVKYEYKSKYDDAPDSLASCLEWIGLIRGKL